MHLIIFAHPDNKASHNAAILKHVKQRLDADFKKYEVIDLYADGFDPVLRLIQESEQKKMLVERYKKLIEDADTLVFIYPSWWYSMPAMLKGFIDIIFSPGFAHNFDPKDGGLRQMLKGKKAIIINTFGRSEKECKERGNPPHLVLDSAVLKFCGMDVISRINWYDVRPPSLIPPKTVNQINDALK